MHIHNSSTATPACWLLPVSSSWWPLLNFDTGVAAVMMIPDLHHHHYLRWMIEYYIRFAFGCDFSHVCSYPELVVAKIPLRRAIPADWRVPERPMHKEYSLQHPASVPPSLRLLKWNCDHHYYYLSMVSNRVDQVLHAHSRPARLEPWAEHRWICATTDRDRANREPPRLLPVIVQLSSALNDGTNLNCPSSHGVGEYCVSG